MADLTQKQYLDLAGLKVYDGKIKGYVDNAVDTLDDAIRGVDGDLTAEIANRKAGDKAINDKVGDTTKLGDLGNTVDAILAVADVIGNQDDLAKNTVIESINANADAIEAEVKRAQAAEKANADAIAAINNGESGVLASAKAYTDTKVGEEKTRAEGVEANLDAAIKAEVSRATSAEGTLQSNIQSSLQDAKAYTDTEVGKEKSRAEAAEEALGKRIDAHAAAVDGKVNTLVGTDEGKSVRKIANEELAAQLLSGDADADFKTLQDLAAWLEDHPESVAAMNTAIAANDTAIKAEVKRAGDAEAALDERLDLVEAAVGQGGNVDARIAAAINALDSTASHASDDDGLSLEVAIVDGKLTSISGSIAAGRYDSHGSANAALDEAKSYADTELAKVYAAMESIPNSEIEALFA